ncbi:MAG: transcriptional regulator MntR [Firmicutes bacterium]|nr:transcriptional regulator MntR [Bacillota bacterium]
MLTESMEDYLEMIYRLAKGEGSVRSVDLAEKLHVQASSVTRMVQKLDEAGFVCYERYRNIALTPIGKKYGKFLIWRDRTLKEFLRLLDAGLGIEEQVEGMEHYVTPSTMALIRDVITFFAARPGDLAALRSLQGQLDYPDSERLPQLRAWDFRHSSDGLQ